MATVGGQGRSGDGSFEQVALGRTPVTVTRLGLGSGALAGSRRPVTAADADVALRHAYARAASGCSILRPLYGHGQAELRTGMSAWAAAARQLHAGSKVGRLLAPYETPGANLDYQDLRGIPAYGLQPGSSTSRTTA